jgi:hypothetical protein
MKLSFNWFMAKGNESGVAEGLNFDAKLSAPNAYGFGTYGGSDIGLITNSGSLASWNSPVDPADCASSSAFS